MLNGGADQSSTLELMHFWKDLKIRDASCVSVRIHVRGNILLSVSTIAGVRVIRSHSVGDRALHTSPSACNGDDGPHHQSLACIPPSAKWCPPWALPPANKQFGGGGCILGSGARRSCGSGRPSNGSLSGGRYHQALISYRRLAPCLTSEQHPLSNLR